MKNLDRMRKIEIEYGNFLMHPNDQNTRDLICALEETFDPPETLEQAIASDSEIVKLLKLGFVGWAYTPELERVIRLIEAKIEGVQDAYNSLCEAEQDHAKRFAGIEDSWLKTEIEGVRKLAENCVKHDSAWVEQITQWRKETKYRIEELENKVSQILPDLTPAKPQPAAYAWDKDHKELHDLRPRVSVLKGSAIPTAVFYSDKGGGLLRVRWLNTGLYGTMHLQNVTWLFDLDFPPFAKAQDVGGDK